MPDDAETQPKPTLRELLEDDELAEKVAYACRWPFEIEKWKSKANMRSEAIKDYCAALLKEVEGRE